MKQILKNYLQTDEHSANTASSNLYSLSKDKNNCETNSKTIYINCKRLLGILVDSKSSQAHQQSNVIYFSPCWFGGYGVRGCLVVHVLW